MKLVDYRRRVLLKLAALNQYLNELEEIFPDEEEYLTNLPIRRACEKTIELAIDGVFDIVAMLVAAEKLGFPQEEESLIDLLAKKKLLTLPLAQKIKRMKGFRNILIHKYGEVDDAQAHEFLSGHLGDFADFEQEIKCYLRKKKS